MENNEYFFNVHTSISIKNTINELNQYLNGNITKKIQQLYKKLDFLQDNDRWVQYREVYKEITELERLRDESYSN